MNESNISIFMLAAIAAIFSLVICTGGCDIAPAEATRILSADGVSNITLTGYSWFACGRDDSFSQGFSGKKSGQSVRGVLCGGWMKGDTIRYR